MMHAAQLDVEWAKLLKATGVQDAETLMATTKNRFVRKAKEIIQKSYYGFDEVPELKAEVERMVLLFKLEVAGPHNQLEKPFQLKSVLSKARPLFDTAVCNKRQERLDEIAEHFRRTSFTVQKNHADLKAKSEILLEQIRVAVQKSDRKVKRTALEMETEDFVELHDTPGHNEPWDSPEKKKRETEPSQITELDAYLLQFKYVPNPWKPLRELERIDRTRDIERARAERAELDAYLLQFKYKPNPFFCNG